jgi:hypothetical protein
MRGYIVWKLVQRLQCVGFALDVLNVCFTKGGVFFKKLVSIILVLTLGGNATSIWRTITKGGDTDIDEMGSSKVFGCFCCTKVIKITYQWWWLWVVGNAAISQPWSDQWCPKSKENAVFGPILTIPSCVNVLNSTVKDESMILWIGICFRPHVEKRIFNNWSNSHQVCQIIRNLL